MMVLFARRLLIFLMVICCGGMLVLLHNLRNGSHITLSKHNNSQDNIQAKLHIRLSKHNNSQDNIQAKLHIRLSKHNNSQDNIKAEPQYNLIDLGELNDPLVKMNDPRLLAAIREKFLRPPSPRSIPYTLKHPEAVDPSRAQQSKIIQDLLNHQKFGFFVEAGALDGEIVSNTLMFERFFNWTGLLVEPDPKNYAKLVQKNRKAWLCRACLSLHTHPHVVSFKQDFSMGKISNFSAGHREPGYVDVQCLPLYSILLAMNQTAVDLFSLDVEGNELDVLRTIPIKDLNIKIIMVEHILGPGKEAVIYYMQNQGFEYKGSRHFDSIFSKRGVLPKD